jgi:hypothetical protein
MLGPERSPSGFKGLSEFERRGVRAVVIRTASPVDVWRIAVGWKRQ